MGFADDFEKFRVKAENKNKAIVKKVVLTLSGRITERMPVDTGRAKANTQVSLREKPFYALNEYDKAGAETTRRHAVALAGYALGDTAWITNNVAYIIPLEFDSHSRQAPNGMFRISIQDILTAWPSIVSEAR